MIVCSTQHAITSLEFKRLSLASTNFRQIEIWTTFCLHSPHVTGTISHSAIVYFPLDVFISSFIRLICSVELYYCNTVVCNRVLAGLVVFHLTVFVTWIPRDCFAISRDIVKYGWHLISRFIRLPHLSLSLSLLKHSETTLLCRRYLITRLWL